MGNADACTSRHKQTLSDHSRHTSPLLKLCPVATLYVTLCCVPEYEARIPCIAGRLPPGVAAEPDTAADIRRRHVHDLRVQYDHIPGLHAHDCMKSLAVPWHSQSQSCAGPEHYCIYSSESGAQYVGPSCGLQGSSEPHEQAVWQKHCTCMSAVLQSRLYGLTCCRREAPLSVSHPLNVPSLPTEPCPYVDRKRSKALDLCDALQTWNQHLSGGSNFVGYHAQHRNSRVARSCLGSNRLV